MRVLPARYFGRATGQHRKADPAAVPGVVVQQQFVRCVPCGGVESAATVHGEVVVCAAGHEQGVAE